MLDALRIRLLGIRVEDDRLIDELEALGWVRRDLIGRYRLTDEGHRHLRQALITRLEVRMTRYRAALRQISAEYPGERDHPGVIARKALGHDSTQG